MFHKLSFTVFELCFIFVRPVPTVRYTCMRLQIITRRQQLYTGLLCCIVQFEPHLHVVPPQIDTAAVKQTHAQYIHKLAVKSYSDINYKIFHKLNSEN